MPENNNKNNSETNNLAKEIEKNSDKKDLKSESFLKKIAKIFRVKNQNNLKILETDLIKDEVEIKFNWRKDLIIFAILLFIVSIFVLEACFLLSRWEKTMEEEYSHYLEKEVADIKDEIELVKDEYDQALDFSKYLAMSADALNRHVYWTNFFSFLEANTLKNNIYYKSFSGDTSGKYILPVVTNDVLAINFQSRALLADPLVSSVLVSDEEIVEIRGKTFINFNLDFNINTKIFN